MTPESTTVAEVRLQNLIRLMRDKFEGRQSNLARAIGRKPDYIWRVMNKQKGFGETLARDIEKILTLPDRWLDDPNNSTDGGGIPNPESRIVVIPYYEGEAGSARQSIDQSEGVPIRMSTLANHGERPESLGIVIMDDQSMSLSIPKGDQVMIDTNAKTPVDGQLFYIQHGNALKVRRLTLDAAEKWAIRCDTHDKMRHPDIMVPEADLHIIGRVIWSAGRR